MANNNLIINLLIVAELAIWEGLLSLDNALILAATVKKNLHSAVDQKKALFYGLIGAYTFRLLAIVLGIELFRYKWIHPIVGIYLIVIAVKELLPSRVKEQMSSRVKEQLSSRVKESMSSRGLTTGSKNMGPAVKPRGDILVKPRGDILVKPRGDNISFSPKKIFWLTILHIEMLDLVFSIDSIAVALAISNEIWVLISGAVLGILMMRFAAQYFIKIITRFPWIQKGAFVLLAFMGIRILVKFWFNE